MSRSKQIGVLLVGKYEIVQESLRHLIESHEGLVVTGLYTFDRTKSDLSGVARADVAVVYLTQRIRWTLLAILSAKTHRSAW